MTWFRWRWHGPYSFGPWTKYHALKSNNVSGAFTYCGRYATRCKEPEYGQSTETPAESKRCAACVRAITAAEAAA